MAGFPMNRAYSIYIVFWCTSPKYYQRTYFSTTLQLRGLLIIMFSSAWWHFVLLFIYLSRIQLATSQDLEIAVVPIQTDNQSGHTTVVVTEIPPLTTPWIIPEDCKTASLSLKKSYNVTYTVSNTPLVHVAQQTLSFFADHCAVGKRSCCPPGWEPGGFYQQTAPPGYTLLSSASIDPQQGIHFNTHMKVVGERTERAQFACPTYVHLLSP